MSGGSFNYLYCAADCGSLSDHTGTIQRMLEALESYDCNYKEAAVKDTKHVLALLEEADKVAVRLSYVWKAVEWHHSGDYAADQAEEALKEYMESNHKEAPHE